MKVTAIMATCGRHHCCERSLSMFLRQDYDNKHLLIYQNSEIYQSLDPAINTNIVTLVNNEINLLTQENYNNLGSIYCDAVKFIPPDTDVITFWDDDDLFLRDHISKGIEGLLNSKKIAYKPAQSYFRTDDETIKVRNTLEPSIFVRSSHIFKFGFSLSTSDQHLQWINPLLEMNEIFIDLEGKSTLIYNWSDFYQTFRTSADAGNINNFNNYRRYSRDHGDKVISPLNLTSYSFLDNL
jgi:hypothetical protein